LFLAAAGLFYAAGAFAWNYDLDTTTQVNVGDFTLTWVPNGGGQYRVQERPDGGSSWTNILTTNSSTSSYAITNQPSGAYEYRIYHSYQDCSGGGGRGGRGGCEYVDEYSNILDVSVITPVTPLISLDGSFTVTWSAVNGATNYKLEVSKNSGSWSQVWSGSATSASLTGRTTGNHRYRLKSCVGSTCTNPSSPSSMEVEIYNTTYAEPTISSAGSHGKTPYSASVDRKGNAMIVIPVRNLPGVNGLAPNISLTYSSGASPALYEDKKSEGVLGYGWNVSGIPEIRRCRVGITGDIEYDSTDRLCLNGNALVLVSGTDYWADNAEYRTEIDTHSKITVGGSGLANRYFSVKAKNGYTTVFGNTATTRLSAPDETAPYLWSASTTTDNFGNQITYTYTELTSIGTNFIRYIDYSDARIEFRYEERCKTTVNCDTTSVQNGENVKGIKGRAVVLNRILTRRASNWVNDYRLDNNYAYGYLRLERLQNCSYNEAGNSSTCMQPMEFDWDLFSLQDTSSGTSADLLVVDEITDSYGSTTLIDYEIIDGYDSSDHALHLPVNGSWFANYTGSFTDTAVSTIERAIVDTIKHPDGGGGHTTTSFLYTGYPLYSTKGRGYIGFPLIAVEYEDKVIFDESTTSNYTGSYRRHHQFRMDFPFIGRESRRFETVDTNPTSTQTWSDTRRTYWDHQASTSYSGTVQFPYVATTFVSNTGKTSSGGIGHENALEITNSYCFKAVSSGTCSTGGTTYEVPTQLKVTTETGLYITSAHATGTFWGDVPTGTVHISSVDHTSTRTFDYSNITSTWLNGFVSRIESAWQVGSTSESQEIDIARDASTNIKPGVIHSHPGHSVYDQTTSISYNSNGNVTSVNETGMDMPTRYTTYSSFLNLRYPQSTSNPLSQSSSYGYDQRFGTVDSITDPNGDVTTITRDQFGRVISEIAPDSTKTTTTYSSCSSGCPSITWASAKLKVAKTYTHNSTGVQLAPDETFYFDELDNLVLTETEAFSTSDNLVRVQRHFDAEGKLLKQSLPYFSVGGTVKFATTYYDFKDRVVHVAKPDGSNIKTTIYSDTGSGGHVNFEVEETGTQRKKKSRFNTQGQLVETTDGFGSSKAVTTDYTYTVRGDLDTVTVDGVQVANINYDAAGNRSSLIEPNTGTTSFTYYSNHWLKQSTDAASQKTKFDYDALGRVTKRYDGYQASGQITNTWTWDSATNGIGQLASRSNGSEFSEDYTYDGYGRLNTITADINVSGFNDNSNYVIDYDFDSSGRLSNIDYPNGFTATNEYTSRGYLSKVKKGSTVLHHYTDIDEYGNITGETYGNGLKTAREIDYDTGELTAIRTGTSSLPKSVQDLIFEWKTDGSLYKRFDKKGTSTTSDDLTEVFSYDDVGRLTLADTAATGRTLTNTYDDHGNLLSKTSDISGDLNVGGYTYGTSGKPHRLTSVTIDGISNTLSYDSVGNIERYNATSGDDTYIDYDLGNRVTKITVGSSSTDTTPTARDEFWHGPDGQRFLRKASWMDGSTLKTSWTLFLQGGVFEEVHPMHDSSVSYVQRVLVTSNVQHRYVKYPSSSGTSVDYLHRDHLGSVVETSNYAGTASSERTFDPFGMQRALGWASDISAASLESIAITEDTYTARGFTDHEMLNRTGFVHMNGRVFDQRIGRFIQPDPIIGQPELSQNFNRYAYVFNNPMSFTDPSGLDCAPWNCNDSLIIYGDEYDLNRHPTHQPWDPKSVDQSGPGSYWDETNPFDPPDVVVGIWDFVAGDSINGAVETYGHVRNGDWKAASIGIAGLGCDIAKACKAISKFGGKLLDKLKGLRSKRSVPNSAAPKPGSAGGPGAGRNFPERVKDQARAESGDTCVFCGRDTIRSKTPHPDRSNIDHSIPKSRGGNNTLDNAQNTCQTCNLDKGTQTTEEYLRNLGGSN